MKNVLRKINKENIKRGLDKYERCIKVYDKFNKDPIKKFVCNKLYQKFSYSLSASSYIYKEDNENFMNLICFIAKINNPNSNKLLIYNENDFLLTNWCNIGDYTVLYKNHIIKINAVKDSNSMIDMRVLTVTIYGTHFTEILDEIKNTKNPNLVYDGEDEESLAYYIYILGMNQA